MTQIEQAIATLLDYVERSSHWQEGGADKHAAVQALQVLARECMPAGARERATQSSSQRMREAGFTRRPTAKSLPSDE